MNSDDKKLNYLIKYTGYYIYENIVQVLEDEDEELSAVTLNNIIICYLDFLKNLELPHADSVYEFFVESGFDDTDYKNFEEKRKLESTIYRGEQF